MVLIRGRLEPEVGAVVMQALAAARDLLYRRRKAKDVPAGTSFVDGSPEAPTMEQQQADALALVAEGTLHQESIPARRASGTRSSYTSMPRCWPMPTQPASRCSKAGHPFRRERRSAWHATPAAW